MKSLADSIRKLIEKVVPDRGPRYEEAYLAQAHDQYDLEYRFRELDRRRSQDHAFTHLRHF